MDQLSQRLAHERVRRGLSTFDLAERTKIREPYIQAIEKSSYNVLPSVYVRSFIRTIAAELGVAPNEINGLISQCLDADSDSTMPSFSQQRSATSTTSSSSKDQRTSDSSDPLTPLVEALRTIHARTKVGSIRFTSRTILFASMGLTVLISAVWYLTSRSGNGSPTDVPEEIVDVTGAAAEDSLVLSAVSSDTAELTITMDGTRYQKITMMPEIEHRWSAMKRFTVSNIFNAGVIQFSRDGQPLPRYGKRGEVLRELVITRTEVIASNTSTKMITAPADPERARRDSVREQQRRDSIRILRRQENQRLAREKRDKLKARSRQQPASPKKRPRQQEQTITKTPPRSIR
jgi:transcriptional regulator with XRE-family HTH domain